MHRYLPPALQEVADIVVSFRHQMERFPNDLLLHVLRLQHTWHSALDTVCEFASRANHPDTQPKTDASSFHLNIYRLLDH